MHGAPVLVGRLVSYHFRGNYVLLHSMVWDVVGDKADGRNTDPDNSNCCLQQSLYVRHPSGWIVTAADMEFSGVDDGMGYHLYDIEFSSVSHAHRLTIWCRYFLFSMHARQE